MSYILDALRKAEGERQRTPVPTLGAMHALPPKRGIRAWRWVAAVVLVANAAALVWLVQFRQTGATSAPAPAGVVATPAPAVTAPSPPIEARTDVTSPREATPGGPPPRPEKQLPAGAARPAAPPVTAPTDAASRQPPAETRPVEPLIAAMPPPPSVPAPPQPAPAAPARPSMTAPAPAPPTPSQPAPAAPAPPSMTAPAPAPPTPSQPAAAAPAPPSVTAPAPAPAPVPLAGPLPAGRAPVPAPPREPPVALREALQGLSLDVLVYSEVEAQRMVFINGRKYVEGQQVDGKLVVETITPDGAVLGYQGQRHLLRPKSNPYAR